MVVDDHAAIRAGLRALLESEPDLEPVVMAGTCAEALDAAPAATPDVALLDYHLPDGDGIELCRRLRAAALPPEVIIYSAFADGRLALPAALVGARAVLDKAGTAERLFETVRAAAAGAAELEPGPALLGQAAEAVDLEDLPILGMLADRTPTEQIAQVLGISRRDVEARATAILERLKQRLPGR